MTPSSRDFDDSPMTRAEFFQAAATAPGVKLDGAVNAGGDPLWQEAELEK